MQDQSIPQKNYTLMLNNIVRAHSVILPADMPHDEVLEHIYETRNTDKWPQDSDNLDIKLIGHDVKLAYVKTKKRITVSRTAEVKEFSKPAYTYTHVKVYR